MRDSRVSAVASARMTSPKCMHVRRCFYPREESPFSTGLITREYHVGEAGHVLDADSKDILRSTSHVTITAASTRVAETFQNEE